MGLMNTNTTKYNLFAFLVGFSNIFSNGLFLKNSPVSAVLIILSASRISPKKSLHCSIFISNSMQLTPIFNASQCCITQYDNMLDSLCISQLSQLFFYLTCSLLQNAFVRHGTISVLNLTFIH